MSICDLCHSEFLCGVVDQDKSHTEITCWCMALPKMPIPKTPALRNRTLTRCLCPDCLGSLRKQALSA